MATEKTVIDNYSQTLTAAAKVTVIVTGKQNYSNLSGSKPWQLALYANGTLIKATGGSGAYTDNCTLTGMFTTSGPATVTFKVTWYGTADMNIEAGCAMTIIVSYK